MIYQLQNEQNTRRVVELLGILNGGPRELRSGEVTTVSTFKPLSLLSELKEPLFTNLVNELTSLQTPKKKY